MAAERLRRALALPPLTAQCSGNLKGQGRCELKSRSRLDWTAQNEIRIEAIKRGFLEQLGLNKPPSVERNATRTGEDTVYRADLHQVTQRLGNRGQRDRGVADTFLIQGMILEDNNQNGRQAKNTQWLVFDMSMCRQKDIEVKRAALSLDLNRWFNRSSSTVRVKIYQVLKPRLQERESHRLFVTSSVVRPHEAVHRITFDIEKAIKHCLAHAQESCSLELQFSSDIMSDSVWASVEIEGYVAIKIKRSRPRRRAASEGCRSNQKQCCRRAMRVSFEEIGWADWIEEPKVYNAYSCDGTCPPRYKADSAYTEIKSRMHLLSLGAVPGPCCVPVAYEPLTILHWSSEGKLTISTLDNMVVSKCSCS
ncbi:growth/differentiation factor 15-like [Amia ocellicauda]|uniref:growth/differentiation factor 15-like n=1 Tax=Amia ocellicauda TaxID=2972642 RepID=UPI0034643217